MRHPFSTNMEDSKMTKLASARVPEAKDIDFEHSEIDLGLEAQYTNKMASRLSNILAATYRLTIKSHLYHWNVVGPLFKPLHELTEEHYNALFSATDIIAERMRALGHRAPVNFSKLEQFAPQSIADDELSATDMVADLLSDHQACVRLLRETAEIAGHANDMVTEDMLTQRLSFHEQAVWMLRATISH